MSHAQTISAYAVTVTPSGERPATTVLEVDSDRAPLPQALEHLYALVDSRAQRAHDLRISNAHDLYAMRDEIERDRDRACDLDAAGVRYTLPGLRLEATAIDGETLDAMTDGFVTALLWADAQPLLGPEPSDRESTEWAEWSERRHSIEEVGESGGLEDREPTSELRERARQLCAGFLAGNADDIAAHMDAFGDPDGGHHGEYVGHTFYLDAAGHGVSFTDRAWRDDDPMTVVCARLNTSADSFREVEHLYAYELADGTVGL